jgi:hypothetical protein
MRVAHNTALTHVVRQCQTKLQNLMTLEELDTKPDNTDYEHVANQQMAFDHLLRLIHRLRPTDRELMLLYLEDLDAPSIAEIHRHVARTRSNTIAQDQEYSQPNDFMHGEHHDFRTARIRSRSRSGKTSRSTFLHHFKTF